MAITKNEIIQKIKDGKYFSTAYPQLTYFAASDRAMKDFRNDLEEAYGLKGNKKADKVFEMAMDYNEEGREQFYNALDRYEDLADLVNYKGD